MEVSPSKQNINELFSTTTFHIDFYQREYKWDRSTVERLLDDLFYSFETAYSQHSSLEPNLKNITTYYQWYYLNTYITNKTDGQLFIVDGQQRLTTLTLIITSLHRLCAAYDCNQRRQWLEMKLAGIGIGGEKQFWLAHEKRHAVMHALLNDSDIPDSELSNITSRNLVDNFSVIHNYLSGRLQDQKRLETFIFYFLCMVVIVNLDVPQTDVPMVFEVINDRGVRLQPYEILKGKLLGLLEKTEVDEYADIWEAHLEELEASGRENVDDFFRTFLKAQFSDTRKAGQAFDGAYHRAIFDSKSTPGLELSSGASPAKRFLSGPFSYYAKLYQRLLNLSVYPKEGYEEFSFASQLNRMDGHVMMSMAACQVDDEEEDDKLSAISKAYDRAYVILQLNRAYDSNEFQELLYSLHPSLRKCQAEDISKIVNKAVLKEINTRRGTQSDKLLPYTQFRQAGYGDYNPTFLRYFLTRIELFISKGLGWNMQDTLHNYVRGTGRSNAYHIEHILARNAESRSLFIKDGLFQEDLFESERNRLGGLLLLKRQDNQSSGDEKYEKKLKTYTGSAPLLARSLVPDFYKSNSAMKDFKVASGLLFEPNAIFDRDALERRSALLYSIVGRIWLAEEVV